MHIDVKIWSHFIRQDQFTTSDRSAWEEWLWIHMTLEREESSAYFNLQNDYLNGDEEEEERKHSTVVIAISILLVASLVSGLSVFAYKRSTRGRLPPPDPFNDITNDDSFMEEDMEILDDSHCYKE